MPEITSGVAPPRRWAARRPRPRLANPFPDAAPEFLRDYARCLGAGLAPHRIEILTPYR
ncbi:hypothetical protein [Streptomyces sp. NPDC086787]|uniref:hypothetical protein n=1 Tax=Streptomyces sp. NPDC086787 TaxID=3365759 RepID=UPI00380FF920